MRPRHAHFPIEPRMMHEHVFLEHAGTDAHEGKAIAMTSVHVRLNLENETGERLARRFDSAARDGRRRELEERSKKRLDTEVVDGASEENRNQRAAREGIAIEFCTCAGEQLRRFAQLGECSRTDGLFEHWIIESADCDRRDRRAVLRALESQHATIAKIVDTLKIRTVADRPIHRNGMHIQLAFDLMREIKRVASATT